MNSRRRRVWLGLVGFVIGVAVSFGVLATLARHRLEAAAVVADDHRAADVVAAIVDSSLEELRERESGRPFDQYNAVYRPEGVVAASDALAPSPLSRAPDDERVLGWLQLNPDGTTTVPFLATRPALATTLLARVATPAFNVLRAQTKEPRAPLVAVSSSASNASRPSTASSSTARTTARAAAIAAARDKAKADTTKTALLADASDVGAVDTGNSKQGVVQQLNSASSGLYSQLQEAEATPSARAAIASQSKLPNVVRNDVVADEKLKPSTTKKKKPARRSTASDDDPVQEKPAPKPTPNPPTATPTVTVDYTPMVFDDVDGLLLLHRTVTSTSDGAQTVQLAVLDTEATRRWLDAVVDRRAGTAGGVSVIGAGEAAGCTLRTSASAILDDVDLCFTTPVQAPPLTEVGVLVSLLLLVLIVLFILDRAAERADVLARQRSAFISSVSHELRTPLTTLRLHAELLRDGLVPDPTKAKRFLDEMVTESVRLSHLVENVLEAQRLEEGRRPLRLTRANLGDVVADVVAGQRALVTQRGFSLELRLPDSDDDNARLACVFDRQAVEQIVVNLIENAVKYAKDASDRRIDVVVGDAAGTAVIEVTDRGPGVPKHERERVFARFTRVERPGEEHVAGSGLGLALVRELAVAHGGAARIKDSAVGCSVEVTLPLRTVGA